MIIISFFLKKTMLLIKKNIFIIKKECVIRIVRFFFFKIYFSFSI
jgi:hypothetical protein